jgi:hypothetical protein
LLREDGGRNSLLQVLRFACLWLLENEFQDAPPQIGPTTKKPILSSPGAELRIAYLRDMALAFASAIFESNRRDNKDRLGKEDQLAYYIVERTDRQNRGRSGRDTRADPARSQSRGRTGLLNHLEA